jgi:small redox-active disulfide protein 2
MTERDVTQITVNNRRIGIIGLKAAIEETAGEYAEKSDEDVQTELMKRLSKKNYIPNRVSEAYGQAFVREFRKHLGQAYEAESASDILEVKIIGTGCARCDWLRQAVIDAVAELNLAADVEHITDLGEIARFPVLGFPALIINGKTVCAGSVPSKENIKTWVQQAQNE